MLEVSLLKNNTNAISGSMTDKVAPSETDMAERLQTTNQATSQQKTTTTTTASYVEALTRGMETPADKNQTQS